MPGAEHLIFKKETTWGTYAAPDTAIPITETTVDPTRPMMENLDTGGGRGRRRGEPGEIAVAGPIRTKLYGKGLGKLLRGPYGTRTSTPVAGGYRTVLKPTDAAAHDSFSLQKRYTDTLAESIRGAKINGYTLGVQAKQYADLVIDMIAKDAASSGGFWTDGSAAPAVIDPVPYPSSQPRPIKFYQGVMRLGGTAATNFDDDALFLSAAMHVGAYAPLIASPVGVVAAPVVITHALTAGVDTLGTITITGTDSSDAALVEAMTPIASSAVMSAGLFKTVTGIAGAGWVAAGGADLVKIGFGWPNGEVVVTGSTDRCEFDQIELAVAYNLSADGYGVCLGDPTVQQIDEGARVITLKFAPNFGAVGAEFYNAWRNGTDAIVQLYFRGDYLAGSSGPRYEWLWSFPLVGYTEGKNPAINSLYGLKRSAVTAMAYVDDTLGLDHTLTITSTENLAA